jgi:cysteine desulfurase
MRQVYLDNNATTRPLPEVREAVLAALDRNFGNPSSVHSAGERARECLEAARSAVSRLIGSPPQNVIFTSGATESNNTAILAAVRRLRKRPIRIVTTAVEHSSILQACEHIRGSDIELILMGVDHYGQVDLDVLKSHLAIGSGVVVIQWANSETGVIQPIETIAELCQRFGYLFHTDAAQSIGKLPIEIANLPVDSLSMSAHKMHGPSGVGALFVRDLRSFAPLLHGGSQEFSLRPGTENVSGIAGFGAAAKCRRERQSQIAIRLLELRNRFEVLVRRSIPDVAVNGSENSRLCNTSNLRFPGVDGQALVLRLDQMGIQCSQSTACTNSRPSPSYVLTAMGLSELEAYASVRFSFGEWNVDEDVNDAVAALTKLCEQLRSFRSRSVQFEKSPSKVS